MALLERRAQDIVGTAYKLAIVGLEPRVEAVSKREGTSRTRATCVCFRVMRGGTLVS